MTDSDIITALIRAIRRRGNRWIVLVAVLVSLTGCIADAIGYTADKISDCCDYLPDTDAAIACVASFTAADECNQVSCGVWSSGWVDSTGKESAVCE